MMSGGVFTLAIAFLMPHDTVLPSFSLFFGVSVFLSYDEIFKPFEIARFIVVPSYLKFKPDLMAGNFLVISNTADATCFDPPYLRSPATVPRFPVLTILPSNPIMLSKDLGFDVEYTKFVWHSGMYLWMLFIKQNFAMACDKWFSISSPFACATIARPLPIFVAFFIDFTVKRRAMSTASDNFFPFAIFAHSADENVQPPP